jgi:hypothetical protein
MYVCILEGPVNNDFDVVSLPTIAFSAAAIPRCSYSVLGLPSWCEEPYNGLAILHQVQPT